MTNRLEEKWVFVTGATSGIGKATAKIFANASCNLIINGRRKKRLEQLQKQLKEQHAVAVEIACFDVRDRQVCSDFISELEPSVDILINNAGLARGKDAVYDAPFEDWDEMIDTNIKGVLNMTRLISPSMKERNTGHIINVGSIAGHESYPGGSVYCASKHAVKAFTEATKKDLHGTNVRVSMVSPGLVETEFSNVRFHGDDERADEVYNNLDPLTGEDIAEIILFMANRPPHVNIMDSIVLPVSQSSSSMVARNE
ncbi:SDR family NAD(P)-dependent oxidoreductase [Fodinibius saliphilus]|uniref:SDR family NAD(P)-dependent oxidoreductase n=1 Tax=Fodinibius saliphilus TaxID=1920650 RepID=UPI001107F3D1|nr:SDR family NAD(P)-dependent oxidoreductase [Fodinibius saliphilus]